MNRIACKILQGLSNDPHRYATVNANNNLGTWNFLL
ncbi:unnamed protein product [Larinioides sclopetarius]|uniref:Uncharacterized protein n=1 Tax=Larinioides sclopetarius TaxID=280406 RepID=A0AAV2AZ07_9ARAC